MVAGRGRLLRSVNSIESFQGLTGNLGNELEVLVHVEHGQAREFAGCRYQEIRNRWGAVMSTVGQEGEQLDGAILDGRRQVLDWQVGQRRVAQF
jgi:hypothetical protein